MWDGAKTEEKRKTKYENPTANCFITAILRLKLERQECRGGGRKEDSEMHTRVYMSTRECGRGGVRKESQGVAFSKGC